jgi:hypothetical protein
MPSITRGDSFRTPLIFGEWIVPYVVGYRRMRKQARPEVT